MGSSDSILASIRSVMNHLQLLRSSGRMGQRISIISMICALRLLRTFILSSRRLDSKVHLRSEQNNGNTEYSSMGSLFVRFEALLCRIHNKLYSYLRNGNKFIHPLMEFNLFDEEMEKWYITLPECLQQSTSSFMANQVMNIVDSTRENLEDARFLPLYCTRVVEEPIENLKENMIFLRNFIRFATLPGTDELRELQDFLAHIEALAINVAHVTVRLFSIKRSDSYHDETKQSISNLLHKIKYADYHAYDTYSRVLARLKHSIRELHVATLKNWKSIVEDFLVSLLSKFWEILQLDIDHVVSKKDQLQPIYEGLRSLRTILKEHPNKFVDVKIRGLVGLVMCDTGILIFSVYQKDVVTDFGVPGLLKNILAIQAEVEVPVLQTSEFNFPETNVLGFLDSLSDNMLEIRSCKFDSGTQSCIHTIEKHLVFLRSILEKLVGLQDQQDDIQSVYYLAVEVAYKMEFLIDQLVLGDVQDSFAALFENIAEDMKIIETDASKISCCSRQPIQIKKVTLTLSEMPSKSSTPIDNEVVGFEIETTRIIDRLTRGSKKLQVVAIVGMPGSGKTSLAGKVYNDPSVMHHFDVRARCSISQVFNKIEVLLALLTYTLGKLSDRYLEKTEGDLVQEFWRSLKRRRYLIFLDDVWDIQSFESLKGSFPDDSTGSRILLTSRQCNVAPEAMLDEKPLSLRLLTRDESLELLSRKLLSWKYCPKSLRVQIAECCKGLPLTIVIVAGMLSTTKQEAWNEVLESLRTGMISNTEQCNNAIELSYRYLPDHLKPCLLYFGVYPEDHVVSVKRLIWYWIAEGFVQKNKFKSSEEVATDYLKNLIGRNLVMEAQKSSTGDVKTCRTHDILHDFCLRKAKEGSFLQMLKTEEELSSFHRPSNLRRLCIYSNQKKLKKSMLFCPRLRSLLFYDRVNPWGDQILDMSFIFSIFKLVKVLDVEHVELKREIEHMVLLRYLAIKVYSDISPSIGNLSNLEIIILHTSCLDPVTLPETVWNLQKLRHIYVTGLKSSLQFPVDNLDSAPNLYELVSLSTLWSPNWSTMEKLLRKFPNIRQLRCQLGASEGDHPDNRSSNLMAFPFLTHLETLHFSFWYWSASCLEFDLLPGNLKKLTLYGGSLPWEKITTVAELPHLEVLKLLERSFYGEAWNVEEGQFPKLRFLKVQSVRIVKWTVSDGYEFPSLQKLVLADCYNLEVIPIECLQYLPTLEMIDVSKCTETVANAVEQIREAQVDMGNSDFKALVRKTVKKWYW